MGSVTRKRKAGGDELASARASVAQARTVVGRYLAECEGGVLGLEPGDVARLAGAAARLLSAECEANERDEKRRQARLNREKTRADTALARARVNALDGLASALAGATDDELAQVGALLDAIRSRGGGRG